MSRPGGRALVVDDDAALRLLARVNLELEGFLVDEAASADEAETAVRNARPDVVLLDVHLGGVSSEGLLERLRGSGIPVALVTGSSEVDDLRGRADAVLTKPFQPAHLVDVARRLARVHGP
ncbi:MAG TPA: response regulator [Gaiellaceae bacterium]|nr:response regulator [Gaiellaceae bacterium]